MRSLLCACSAVSVTWNMIWKIESCRILADYRRKRYRDPVLGWKPALFPTWSPCSSDPLLPHRAGSNIRKRQEFYSVVNISAHLTQLRTFWTWTITKSTRLCASVRWIASPVSIITSTVDSPALKPDYLGNKFPAPCISSANLHLMSFSKILEGTSSIQSGQYVGSDSEAPLPWL